VPLPFHVLPVVNFLVSPSSSSLRYAYFIEDVSSMSDANFNALVDRQVSEFNGCRAQVLKEQAAARAQAESNRKAKLDLVTANAAATSAAAAAAAAAQQKRNSARRQKEDEAAALALALERLARRRLASSGARQLRAADDDYLGGPPPSRKGDGGKDGPAWRREGGGGGGSGGGGGGGPAYELTEGADDVLECMYFRVPRRNIRRGYVRLGYGIYSRALAYWWTLYPREQLLVLRSDDLKADPKVRWAAYTRRATCRPTRTAC